MTRILPKSVLALIALLIPGLAVAQITVPDGFEVDVFSTAVDNPTCLAFAPDDQSFTAFVHVGNVFVYADDGHWQFNLKTKDFAPGTYTVSMVSGGGYKVAPTCVAQFEIQ